MTQPKSEKCPECGAMFSRAGIDLHRIKKHGSRSSSTRESSASQAQSNSSSEQRRTTTPETTTEDDDLLDFLD